MSLMDKVRQVGESYELNKYKALNKTIELDASLANERLFATKLRLNQVNGANDKLSKQLRLLQQQYRAQEQKLLLTETMLRQFVGARGEDELASNLKKQSIGQQTGAGRLSSRFRGGKKSPSGGNKHTSAVSRVVRQTQLQSVAKENSSLGFGIVEDQAGGQEKLKEKEEKEEEEEEEKKEEQMAINKDERAESNKQPLGNKPAGRQVSNMATQTQTSRTKMIINDLRQRLNLVGSKSKGLNKEATIGREQSGKTNTNPVSQIGIGIQTITPAFEEDCSEVEFAGLNEDVNTFSSDSELEKSRLVAYSTNRLRQKSISLNDILSSSFVHESATGERIIISRGWPSLNMSLRATNRRGSGGNQHHRKRRHRQHNETNTTDETRRRLVVQPPTTARRRLSTINVASSSSSSSSLNTNDHPGRMNKEQKHQLLLEFLKRNSNSNYSSLNLNQANHLVSSPYQNMLTGANYINNTTRTNSNKLEAFSTNSEVKSALNIGANYNGLGSNQLTTAHQSGLEGAPTTGASRNKRLLNVQQQTRRASRGLVVQYDLPVYLDSATPIVLPES